MNNIILSNLGYFNTNYTSEDSTIITFSIPKDIKKRIKGNKKELIINHIKMINNLSLEEKSFTPINNKDAKLFYKNKKYKHKDYTYISAVVPVVDFLKYDSFCKSRRISRSSLFVSCLELNFV